MNVVWTPKSERDRRTIWEYIASENPDAAAEMDQLFSDAAARLESFPMLGGLGHVPGTREFIPHERYRLVDEIDKASDIGWGWLWSIRRAAGRLRRAGMNDVVLPHGSMLLSVPFNQAS